MFCEQYRDSPQSLVKFKLFNTQSISNKSTLIEEHIREKGLDFMCLTETWHQPEVYSALNEACPPGYSYLEAARSTGQGGGLAVTYKQDLELSPISLPATSSCECLAFKCKPPSTGLQNSKKLSSSWKYLISSQHSALPLPI